MQFDPGWLGFFWHDLSCWKGHKTVFRVQWNTGVEVMHDFKHFLLIKSFNYRNYSTFVSVFQLFELFDRKNNYYKTSKLVYKIYFPFSALLFEILLLFIRFIKFVFIRPGINQLIACEIFTVLLDTNKWTVVKVLPHPPTPFCVLFV